MAYGKKLTTFLADGSPTGIRHVEIANWSGQAIACPRNRLPELKEWEEVRRPGVYFLFEKFASESENRVYIGEAENVWDRLYNHDRTKEFWNEVVIFSNKDENLTKSHIKYLESRLIEMTTHANRFTLENSKASGKATLPRADQNWLEEFIDIMRIVLGSLAYRVIEPLKQEVSTSDKNNSLIGLQLNLKIKEIVAKGQITDDGFLLLEGSEFIKEANTSLPESLLKMRDQWQEEGILQEKSDKYILQKDVLFSSSSYAAAVVAGTSRSGPQSWVDEAGRTLKVIEEQMLGEGSTH